MGELPKKRLCVFTPSRCVCGHFAGAKVEREGGKAGSRKREGAKTRKKKKEGERRKKGNVFGAMATASVAMQSEKPAVIATGFCVRATGFVSVNFTCYRNFAGAKAERERGKAGSRKREGAKTRKKKKEGERRKKGNVFGAMATASVAMQSEKPAVARGVSEPPWFASYGSGTSLNENGVLVVDFGVAT